MKYTLIFATVAALGAAQSITDLPTCSLSCFTSSVPKIGCGLTDTKCACQKADQLTPSLTPCVQAACSAADQAKVVQVLQGICQAAGVPINTPAPATTTTPAVSTPAGPSATSAAPVPTTIQSAVSSISALSSAASAQTCSVVTTVTVTVPKASSITAPYPTGTAKPNVPAGTGVGTGVAGASSSGPSTPQFTGAAVALKVPAAIAGVVGLAAFVL